MDSTVYLVEISYIDQYVVKVIEHSLHSEFYGGFNLTIEGYE